MQVVRPIKVGLWACCYRAPTAAGHLCHRRCAELGQRIHHIYIPRKTRVVRAVCATVYLYNGVGRVDCIGAILFHKRRQVSGARVQRPDEQKCDNTAINNLATLQALGRLHFCHTMAHSRSLLHAWRGKVRYRSDSPHEIL